MRRLRFLTLPFSFLISHFEHVFFLFLFIFSFWLMFHTFSYDRTQHTFEFATTVWSDFGAQIPLIRSFSRGANWPPEHPLFPGEPIRYHYFFYLVVGLLERIGLPIDWAFNLPSALGFFLLTLTIYILGRTLCKKKSVGVFSVLFFLFNGTLSFLPFFRKHPFSGSTVSDILTNTRFPAFGPWDGGQVTAFWNLNIFTNQRHLGLSLGMLLLIIYILLKLRATWSRELRFCLCLLVGMMIGMLLLFNQAAAMAAIIFAGWFFLIKPATRLPLFVGAFAGLPWFLLYAGTIIPSSAITWKIGYLIKEPLTLDSFATHWVHNLGLHILLIPLGFLLAPKPAKIVFPPLIVLFLLGNLFQFSPDMINNHKFFNIAVIIGSIYSAYGVVWIWGRLKFLRALRIFPVGLLLFSLTFSGIIDFLVVKNDTKGNFPDVEANADAGFFASSTNPRDIILTTAFFYHPASLAGRPIYYGYPYFTWSYGHPEDQREEVFLAILRSDSPRLACVLLVANNIAFVEISDRGEDYLKPNRGMFEASFIRVYRNDQSGMSVYDVKASCL